MEKTYLIAINKWFYFSMNYTYGFIEKVWGDTPMLAEHLRGKFEGLCRYHDSYGAMNAFYAELDWDNRVKLMNWVMENYNDEQRINFGE